MTSFKYANVKDTATPSAQEVENQSIAQLVMWFADRIGLTAPSNIKRQAVNQFAVDVGQKDLFLQYLNTVPDEFDALCDDSYMGKRLKKMIVKLTQN